MTITKLYGIFVTFGCLFRYVCSGAYEINMNGQTIQVNVLNEDGSAYNDRREFTDDYGALLDRQKNAICSSLRDEQCQQVTNNGAQTHNLFNYFPNHADESVVAHANKKFAKNESPHLWKQAMDDRTVKFLSRQNPNVLGTKPIGTRHSLAQSLLDTTLANAAQTLFDPLHLVGSKKIKHKKKKKKTTANEEASLKEDTNAKKDASNEQEEDYDDVEIELYSASDTELANVLGLDDEGELSDTVDRIVAQLVASYLDNDSEDVDVSQVFAANEIHVENGDVSMQELILDEASMEEINELLSTINKKKQNGNSDTNDEIDGNELDGQIFALKFAVASDEITENEQEENQVENDNNDDNEPHDPHLS